MTRHECINCGTFIVEVASSDPYMCRQCERMLEGSEEIERLEYLENL
ncbi:MAG TPA: hypothetical protein VJI97_03595 [Candidatus Nanoarchaeia archaeon]|nr:hypothetical protein [Candidatus Nanoarchaeia archaeon]